MSFFTFKQNNSGGSFQESDNYGYAIIIEASSAQEANTKAEEQPAILRRIGGISKTTT